MHDRLGVRTMHACPKRIHREQRRYRLASGRSSQCLVEAINRSLRKSPDDHAQIAPALALFPADERRIFFRTALQYRLRRRSMAIIEQFFANSKRIAIVYSRRCIAQTQKDAVETVVVFQNGHVVVTRNLDVLRIHKSIVVEHGRRYASDDVFRLRRAGLNRQASHRR